MAKYCANCGKPLPEGVDVCPNCGGAAKEDGAAPFTRMTASTEKWQTQAVKKERPKRTRSQKQMLAYIAAAIAVVALAVFLILYIQPSSRVVRAIRSGDYDRAMEIYWGNSSLAAGDQDAQLEKPLLHTAEQIVAAFSRHELSADEAASALSKLGTFGEGAETLLAGTFAEFRAYSASQDHLAQAEQLSLNGDYLAAREEYLQVIEGDSAYAEAQEKAAASLDRYGESVLSEADVYIQSKDYGSAIAAMEAGKRVLLGFDVYNEKLDYKLNATYDLFERALLAEAADEAALEEYAAAAELLRAAMEAHDFETDTLTSTMQGYLGLAQDKEVADAAARADVLYDEGSYTEAFALLEELPASLPESMREDIDAAVAALEQRFAADRISEAGEIFDGKRDKLPEAVSALRAALRIRRLDEIQAYLDEISLYLPASLAELEYVDKAGTLLRSTSTFESLDGTDYDGGWIWGEDGAEVTFVLDGNYDLLKGILTDRRDDKVKASGHFVVLCDGEEAFVSDTLTHPDKTPIEIAVDISGCERLTLRFVNDYSVRTADNGYCYHGLCEPTVIKYMEGEDAGPEAETDPAAPEAGTAEG